MPGGDSSEPPMNKTTQNTLLAGAGLAVAGHFLSRSLRKADLRGQAVLITGGSRGLGLALAREFAKQGCRLALCARTGEDLDAARADLEARGADVMTYVCDVSDPTQVGQMVDAVAESLGRIDVLVNNAGIISVGPVQDMTRQDFEDALAVDFWGVLNPILAVLPQMRERKSGRIVTITSIGGKVSIPHLLPYSCAKFAATALSEGLRAELARDGITVTTIVPGLLRTGSYFNALFKGDKPAEFAWFGLGDNLPGLSISAERAAREIVGATRRGDAERILSVPANVLALIHGLAPGVMSNLMKLVNLVGLPAPSGDDSGRTTSLGKDVADQVPAKPAFDALTVLVQAAAERLNQGA